MSLTPDRQRFAKAVGFIVMLQGVAWLTLSIIGIVVKRSPPSKMTNNDHTYNSYSDYLARTIYDEFFGQVRDKVIRPGDFEAFLWIYVVLSAVWVVASIDQNFALKQKRIRHSHLALLLGVILLVTSVIDLVLVCLLGRDFSDCPLNFTRSAVSTTVSTTTLTSPTTTTDDTPGTGIDCQLAIGIIMSIAARGYVLWLFNVVTGLCLIFFAAKALRKPALFAYGKSTIPRPKLTDTITRSRKTHSPSNNDLTFFGDDRYPSPAPPIIQDPRNKRNMPVALSNGNQNIYF